MENKIVVKYGLLLANGTLARCDRRNNAGKDYCDDMTVSITQYGYDEWLTDDLTAAVNLLKPDRRNPYWYNAGNDTPIVTVDLTGARVVKVTSSIQYKVLTNF